jgi:aryl-alcohol dehydrogenase-like predicted oxidoreductase
MSISFSMTWSNNVKPKDTLQDAGNQNRRDFIKSGTASIAALSAGVIASPASDEAMSKDKTPDMEAKAVKDTMPTRNLGKTGYRVGIFGLGGQAALDKANNESLALQMIHRALELGVNYFDTSAIYGGHDRWSERHLGKGLKGNRDQVVIATKTKERTRDAALKDLDVSLKLLDTDHIDIWQLHDVGIQEDIDQIFGKGGAIEALVQARDQKIVRHLGVTGRFRPEALIESISRFPFDTILMAVNAADKYYYSFEKDLLPLAVEKQMGIIGMKVMARGRILSSWTPPPVDQQKHSWEGRGAITTVPGTLTKRETFFYNLSLPISTAIIGCDSVEQVEECAELARSFTPLNQAQMAALEAKVEPVAKQALFFRLMPR